MARGENAFAIGNILDKIERSAKDVAKSLDSMRDRIDHERLVRARTDLESAIGGIDALLTAVDAAT